MAQSLDELGPFDFLFILNEKGEPVREPNVLKWAQWRQAHRDEQNIGFHAMIGQSVQISTIFLGVDQRPILIPDLPPMVFETMVFRKGKIVAQRRYCTRAAALAGHAESVAYARRVYGEYPGATKAGPGRDGDGS